jgi:hypothetical protein
MLSGSVELFIHYKSVCIFYLNFQNPGEKPVKDVQLISGFLDANSMYFNELGLGKHSNLFRILRGNTEFRMLEGDPIQATLLLKDLQGLDEKAYYELDELTRAIINRFQQEYLSEIEEFITRGTYRFKGIDHYIEDETEKMKEHIFSSYLMQILGLAINKNVIRNRALELIPNFNRIYENIVLDKNEVHNFNMNVKNEIEQSATRITLINIIKSVNKQYTHIWALFQVPIIELL